MMTGSDIGTTALLLAFVMVGYAGFAVILGDQKRMPELLISGQRAVYAVAFLYLVASGILLAAFLTSDFGVKYVSEHSSRSMPWYYTASAFYGGQEGSLLYWGAMLSIFSAVVVYQNRIRYRELIPYVIVTLMGIQEFFLGLLCFVSSPFTRLPFTPPDGQGLNPLLQDTGMLIHPPMLLMGYMSFSIPFAFAIAALITGRLDSGWLSAIRRWTITAWAIQSCGLLLGAWWAYHVLGWGGYWGWDPVENAALLPWLTGTAFLHSLLVQERRGLLKGWSMGLVIATFALSIFGTFEVRSGIVSSVHSFSLSAIGPFFFAFLVVVLAVSLGLCFYRLPRLQAGQELDSFVSREASFLFNNLLLVAVAFATFWGTLFPVISETVRGVRIAVGPPYYQQVNGPLFLALLVLLGIGPLLAWRRSSVASLRRNLVFPLLLTLVGASVVLFSGFGGGWQVLGFAACTFALGTIILEYYHGVRARLRGGEMYLTALWRLVSRGRRRYGGYLVHLGVVVIAIGVLASTSYQLKREVTLAPGEHTTLGGYTLTFQGLQNSQVPDVKTTTALLRISQAGKLLGTVYPAREFHAHFENQPVTRVSITTFGLQDLYIFLAGWDADGSVTIRVYLNPLVVFIWAGGMILFTGGLITWWPERAATRLATRLALPECEQVPSEV